MSEKHDLQKIFDSMPPPHRHTPRHGTPAVDLDAPPEDRDPETPAPEKPAFDPYKFQVLTVSPTLRQELVGAKLARLDPEYFHDTLPPGRVTTSEPGSMPPPVGDSVVPAPPARRRRGAFWLAFLLGAGGGLALWLLLDSPRPEGEQRSPVPAAALREAPRPGQGLVAPSPVAAAPPAPVPAPAASPAREPATPHPEPPGEPVSRAVAAPRRGDKPLRGGPASKHGDDLPRSTAPANPSAASSGKTFWTEPR